MHATRFPHPPSHVWLQIQNLPQIFDAFLIMWLRNFFFFYPFFPCLASGSVGLHTVSAHSVTNIQAGPRTFFGLPTLIFTTAKSSISLTNLFYRLLLTVFQITPLARVILIHPEIVPIDNEVRKLLMFTQSYLLLGTLKCLLCIFILNSYNNLEVITHICAHTRQMKKLRFGEVKQLA